jgi:hypothetical protein
MGKQWAGGWRWALVVGATTALVVVLGIAQLIGGFSGTATATQILGVVPPVVTFVRWGRGKRASPDAAEPRSVTPLHAWGAVFPDDVLRGLYAAVTRDLPGPEETWPARFGLPAHWLAAGPDLAGEWAGQAHPGEQAAGLSKSAAGGGGIVAEYSQLPVNRLVLLGGAGAGKTTLATRLVLDWHKFPELSGQVPVPVRIDTWNPGRRSFKDWFCDQLTSCYGQDPARSSALAASYQVIPVLDRFDELAPDLRRLALEQLTGIGTRPLVLVSRTEEYRAAVQAYGRPLQAAAGIVLQDLSPTEAAVAAYLRQGSAGWDELLARLRAAPLDQQVVHLNEALSTPMLIRLARENYQQPGRDPGSLLDEGRFAAREDIENHLLPGLVTAAYPGDRSWRAGQAQRWLGFLARRARGRPSQVCWWQLETATPVQAWAALLSGGAAFGLVFGLAPVVLFGPWLGGGTAVAVGVVSGVLGLAIGVQASQVLPAPGMKRLSRLLRSWLWGVFLGFALGLAIAVVVVVTVTHDPHPVAGWATVAKLTFFWPVLAGWAMAGDIANWSRGRIDMPAVSSPAGLLNADRAATIGESILLAVVFGGSIGTWAALSATGVPHSISPAQAFFRGLLLGVLYAVAYALTARAWSRWNLFGRIPLALFRLQPWRTIKFLEDARDRGILRHAGLAYEFRTEALRRYLATWSGSGTPQVNDWLVATMLDIPLSRPAAQPDASVGFDDPR